MNAKHTMQELLFINILLFFAIFGACTLLEHKLSSDDPTVVASTE